MKTPEQIEALETYIRAAIEYEQAGEALIQAKDRLSKASTNENTAKGELTKVIGGLCVAYDGKVYDATTKKNDTDYWLRVLELTA